MDQNLRPYVKSNKKFDIQKNSLNEMVLLSTQNIRKKIWVRKNLQFYAENVCLSKHVIYIFFAFFSKLFIDIKTDYFRSSFGRFNFINTALKELGPFLFDILIPGIHIKWNTLEQGYLILHNKTSWLLLKSRQ